MNKEMEKALNKQINAEIYSSYLYLSMAAHFDSVNLPGLSGWMKQQAKEEMGHAMKFYGYIYERGGSVKLETIDAPKTQWSTVLEVFEDTLAHEKKVTKMIYELVDLAARDKDHATSSMLKWFVDEQVEEESTAEGIVNKLKLIKDNTQGLLMIDSELGMREKIIAETQPPVNAEKPKNI